MSGGKLGKWGNTGLRGYIGPRWPFLSEKSRFCVTSPPPSSGNTGVTSRRARIAIHSPAAASAGAPAPRAHATIAPCRTPCGKEAAPVSHPAAVAGSGGPRRKPLPAPPLRTGSKAGHDLRVCRSVWSHEEGSRADSPRRSERDLSTHTRPYGERQRSRRPGTP